MQLLQLHMVGGNMSPLLNLLPTNLLPNLHLVHFVHTAPPLARQTGRECLWKRDLKCAAELRLLAAAAAASHTTALLLLLPGTTS